MKNFNTIIFLVIFSVSMTAIGQNSQEKLKTENNKLETNVETIIENNEVASLQTNWFTGSTQEVGVKIKNSTTVLSSKKEMYLQSGLSNKTLLIRSLLKKADSNINATV